MAKKDNVVDLDKDRPSRRKAGKEMGEVVGAAFEDDGIQKQLNRHRRDLFAAHALQALLIGDMARSPRRPVENIADDAFTFADAMLKASET